MLAIQGTTSTGEIPLGVELISGGITSAWNVSTIASRTVGMNLEIVLSATRKLYINCLNVAPVAMCLSIIASTNSTVLGAV